MRVEPGEFQIAKENFEIKFAVTDSPEHGSTKLNLATLSSFNANEVLDRDHGAQIKS